MDREAKDYTAPEAALKRAHTALREIEHSIKMHGQDQVYQAVFGRHKKTFEEARAQTS